MPNTQRSFKKHVGLEGANGSSVIADGTFVLVVQRARRRHKLYTRSKNSFVRARSPEELGRDRLD
jgi:hypothetical protein